ncbi:MAG: RNA polymerase sigma factor [Actinomycetota bacterium]
MRARSPGPETTLMRSFALGDGSSAARLYDLYAARIYGLGLVMLGNEAAAEDLVQDTFVKAWRNAERYDVARGSLDTWILLMARNLAIDSLRRRVLEARAMDATRPRDESDPSAGPETLAETADLADRARRAMSALSDGQRAALELAYFGGKTSAEVAELEGIPLGTAKTRIRTALLKLRESLEAPRDV